MLLTIQPLRGIQPTYKGKLKDFVNVLKMLELASDVFIAALPILFYLFAAFVMAALFKVLLFAISPGSFPSLSRSCLYYGRVKHTRLKGGAVHHLDYPVFFSFLDLEEMKSVGWSLWPIFAVNKSSLSFCSFDYKEHLKDFRNPSNESLDLLDLCKAFMTSSAGGKLDGQFDRVQILTHLTYFGYCFNPISIYYLKSNRNEGKTEAVIAEVSNTPWIEMHTYPLHNSIKSVTSYNYFEGDPGRVEAVWRKEFHVSPFMEMDYRYSFVFFEPGESIRVNSKLLKLSTNETWFTANFELKKMPFTPLNLLYVLIFYPLHTRIIQVLIHYEAVKLFWKGVPTYQHPHGTDVNFGFGITGERIGAVLWILIWPFYTIYNIASNSNAKKTA